MCFSAKSLASSAQGTHISPLQIPPFAGISFVVSKPPAAAPAFTSYFLTSTVIAVLLTISLMFVTPPAAATPHDRIANTAIDIIFVSINFLLISSFVIRESHAPCPLPPNSSSWNLNAVARETLTRAVDEAYNSICVQKEQTVEPHTAFSSANAKLQKAVDIDN